MTARPARQAGQRAARTRRYRQRQRDGVLMVTIAVTVEEVSKLAALGISPKSELEDRTKIAAAIGALIDAIEIA